MPKVSQRLENLPPYVFAVIGQKVREMELAGIDLIRMDIGSPDLPPAQFTLDALNNSAANPDNHGYSGYTGIPRFREAIARYYKKRFDVDLNPEKEVLPLIGSKEGIVNLILAYIDRGDVALIPDVSYPAYSMGTILAGGENCFVRMPEEKGFRVDVSSIPKDVADKAKLLWVNYPNNPTGAVADLDFYEEVVAFCKKHDILLASDNPYCDVTFDGYKAPSALQVKGAKENTIEFMSLSKSYNMAGWRLGAAVGSPVALKNLLGIKSNVDSGHFVPIYDAGITAIDNTTDAWMAERNMIYQRRRDVVMSELSSIGLKAEKPKASLYIWAKVLDMTPVQYIEEARDIAHVSIAPGAAYGPGGEQYIRISLTITEERLAEGIKRLKNWYQNRK
jgi:LL-diaminopimelate aminotransferase